GIRDATVTGVQTCALPISLYDWAVLVEAPRALPHRDSRHGELAGGARAGEVRRRRAGEEIPGSRRYCPRVRSVPGRGRSDRLARSEERRVGKGGTGGLRRG